MNLEARIPPIMNQLRAPPRQPAASVSYGGGFDEKRAGAPAGRRFDPRALPTLPEESLGLADLCEEKYSLTLHYAPVRLTLRRFRPQVYGNRSKDPESDYGRRLVGYPRLTPDPAPAARLSPPRLGRAPRRTGSGIGLSTYHCGCDACLVDAE